MHILHMYTIIFIAIKQQNNEVLETIKSLSVKESINKV